MVRFRKQPSKKDSKNVRVKKRPKQNDLRGRIMTAKKKVSNKLKDLADTITAVTIIGGALLGVGTWAFNEMNKSTNEKLDTIIEKVDAAEEDAVRAQLLILMNHYPDNESEILKVAEYYFQDLGGDWYITGLFTKWAAERGLDISDIVKVKGK